MTITTLTRKTALTGTGVLAALALALLAGGVLVLRARLLAPPLGRFALLALCAVVVPGVLAGHSAAAGSHVAAVTTLSAHVVKVAESGISGPADAARYAREGAQALLIGEALVKNGDPQQGLADIITACADATNASAVEGTPA